MTVILNNYFFLLETTVLTVIKFKYFLKTLKKRIVFVEISFKFV